MNKLCAIAGLLFASILPLPACADSLQLMSSTASSNGGAYIYPYSFSVNNSSTLVALMCLNYNREITQGEKWAVTQQAVPLDSSTASADYRADAWLYSQLSSYSTEDVQYAVWSIFDPADTQAQPQFSATAKNLAAQALGLTGNVATLGTAFYNQYQLYLPTSDQTGWTAGKPQDFIGVAVTPEPANLSLVATGILCVLGVWYRKRMLVA